MYVCMYMYKDRLYTMLNIEYYSRVQVEVDTKRLTPMYIKLNKLAKFIQRWDWRINDYTYSTMCWYRRCRGLYKIYIFSTQTVYTQTDILQLKRICVQATVCWKKGNNANIYHQRAMNIHIVFEGCLFFSSCFESYI